MAGVRVCMLMHKGLRHDARVRREAAALAGVGHTVNVIEIASPESSWEGDRDGYCVSTLRAQRRLEQLIPWGGHWPLYAVMMLRAGMRMRPDVVHAHDDTLAVGWAVARRSGARLVYDSHELATSVAYGSWRRRLMNAVVERQVLDRCDAVLTVSDGIADRLRERYRLRRRPAVVRNLPDAEMMTAAAAPDLRAQLGIGSAPLVLHQGGVKPERGCETLIRAIVPLAGVRLLFLGTGPGRYAERLSSLAAQLGVEPRVHFQPPAPLEGLLHYTAQADVGVSLLEPTCENHRLALPNKVFEYIAAGVPVVVSRSPELERVVSRYGVGCTADPRRSEDVTRALREALAARDDPGLAERLAGAAERLSWDHESARLLEAYREIGVREEFVAAVTA